MPPLKYRKRGRPFAVDTVCGTWRGYHRHYRRGEQACVPCCTALAWYEEDQRLAPYRREILDAEVAAYDKRHRGERPRPMTPAPSPCPASGMAPLKDAP